LHEEVTPSERALGEEIIRQITVTDILGLSRLRLSRRVQQPIRVLPSRGQVGGLRLLDQLVPGDQISHPEGKAVGDNIETRAYNPGDPLKLILWKVYARTGRLLVRQPELAVAPSDKTMAWLVAGQGDEPAAGIARAVLENGSLGRDYLFGADGADSPTRDASEALEQVVRSVNFRKEGAESLGNFLARGEAQGVSACVLFVPSVPGEWLDRVLQTLPGHRGPFRVIIGVDGMPVDRCQGRLRRLLLKDEPARVHDQLLNAGAEVRILDRLTGEIVRRDKLGA
jgi:hypothetical protein